MLTSAISRGRGRRRLERGGDFVLGLDPLSAPPEKVSLEQVPVPGESSHLGRFFQQVQGLGLA